MLETNIKPQTGPQPTSTLNQILSDLNQHLHKSLLEELEVLGPELDKTLHDDSHLPDPKHVELAATTVDLLHKVQTKLDPLVLILADHFLGYVRSKCLSAAVERGIPDALSKGPMTLDELAKSTESRSDRLSQILRILYTNGIFTFDSSTGTIANNQVSSLLRSDHWTQWHNWVTLYGNQFYDIARGIPESVRSDTKRWAAQINYDTDENMFSYFRSQGWVPQLHRTLGGSATAQMPGILEDYPWQEVSQSLVMDLGGGGGGFIAGLLQKYPTMRGGIFDLPHVLDHVRPFFRPGGQFSKFQQQVLDQDLIAGDFFKSIPERSVYTMKWCLHDWKDPEALAILKNIRSSIVQKPGSTLVVLESILSDAHSGRLSHYGDINMMMTANGQERTEAQWRDLVELAGWRVERIYDLRRAWVNAIDLRPFHM